MAPSNPLQYPLHTLETAPEKARESLRVLRQDFGFIPNVAAAMAESSVALNAFVDLFTAFHHGTFTGAQRQVLLLTNAVTNGCPWAVALHSALALHEGVTASDVREIREGRRPADEKLAALSRYARSLIEKRGRVGAEDVTAFTRAGFARDQTLEVLVATAGSVFTNYTAGIADPKLEDHLEPQAWTTSEPR
jgi:AhpD family alkylhydroperoxidase